MINDRLTTCFHPFFSWMKLNEILRNICYWTIFLNKMVKTFDENIVCLDKPFKYRVGHKFSDTWNVLFVVNWFISNFFWRNTKWKKVSCSHYVKIWMKLSKHGISYSLKHDPRSISKIIIECIFLSQGRHYDSFPDHILCQFEF